MNYCMVKCVRRAGKLCYLVAFRLNDGTEGRLTVKSKTRLSVASVRRSLSNLTKQERG